MFDHYLKKIILFIPANLYYFLVDKINEMAYYLLYTIGECISLSYFI